MQHSKEQIVAALNEFGFNAIPGEVVDASRSIAAKGSLAHYGFAGGIAMGWMARDGLATAEPVPGELLEAEPQAFGAYSKGSTGILHLRQWDDDSPAVFYSEAAARAYVRSFRLPPGGKRLNLLICPILPDGTPGDPIESC